MKQLHDLPTSSWRPISIADLMLTYAFVAGAIGYVYPGYQFAFTAGEWLPSLPSNSWTAITLASFTCCFVIGALQAWIGWAVIVRRSSILLKLLGLTLVAFSPVTAFAFLAISRSAAIELAG